TQLSTCRAIWTNTHSATTAVTWATSNSGRSWSGLPVVRFARAFEKPMECVSGKGAHFLFRLTSRLQFSLHRWFIHPPPGFGDGGVGAGGTGLGIGGQRFSSGLSRLRKAMQHKYSLLPLT